MEVSDIFQDCSDTTTVNGKEYDSTHGSPFDRGMADSYYHRPRSPHYRKRTKLDAYILDYRDMTEEQIAAYNAGYDYNETEGSKKQW